MNYTARGDGSTRIVRYRAANGRALPGSAQEILRVEQPYANHNGGNLEFGPDGKLWVGLGDGGSGGDPENRAQNPDVLLGKMFRLDVRQAKPTPELVAIGLRNPWRYSFDRATGDLWIGDVGQSEIEEIDRLPRATTGLVNFGWNVYEGRSRFSDADARAGDADPAGRAVHPRRRAARSPAASSTAARRCPRLTGRYVFGDYCSGTIWSIAGARRRASPRAGEGRRS